MDPNTYDNPMEFNPSRWDVSDMHFNLFMNFLLLVNVHVIQSSGSTKLRSFVLDWVQPVLNLHIIKILNPSLSQTSKFRILNAHMQDMETKPASYFPFGVGPKMCPGSNVARLSLSVILHYFLLSYR